MKTTTSLFAAVSLLALMSFVATPAIAVDTVTTEKTVIESTGADTTVQQTIKTVSEKTDVKPGTRMYKVEDFDLNKDGILSREEVGEKLFRMYDFDGNGLIDNVEYERRAVLTVVPIEKETTIVYDFDGDGKADKVESTSEVFLRESQLSRFDKNNDGLSPHEFAGRSFLQADVNKDKGVDKQEWRGTYIESLDKYNKERARVNK